MPARMNLLRKSEFMKWNELNARPKATQGLWGNRQSNQNQKQHGKKNLICWLVS